MATKADSVTRLDARSIVDLDLEGIKLIEASAGTGKTHTIADLYLRQILAGRLTAEILIVTYTNAATDELRGRIRQRLYHALNVFEHADAGADKFLQYLLQQWQSLDGEQREKQLYRIQLAVRSMDEASISTIHSFCQHSLQENALSGNQLFDCNMLTDDKSLWEAAIKDWWRRLTYQPEFNTWQLIGNRLPKLDKLSRILLELRNKPAARLLPAQQNGLTGLLDQAREISLRLYELAPLWHDHHTEVTRIISDSGALSRAKTLPYAPQNQQALFDAADQFFGDSPVGLVFENFDFLGSDCLHHNSKPSKTGTDPDLDHEFFASINPLASSWQTLVTEITPVLLADAYHYADAKVFELKQQQASLAFQDQLSMLLKALDSPNGNALARRLRQQYPVAMIDEFQDTDTIQYQIFKYIYLDSESASVVLIGDPKQAIYSFRGGDIFTYMQARRLPGIDRLGLQTNWRSQPNLVNAINSFFCRRADAFVYHNAIPFSEAGSVAQNQCHELQLQGNPATAMTLWQLPEKETGGNFSRDEMRDLVNRAIVIEITRLLEQANQHTATIDGKPVSSGDITILVRQASEGHALSKLLHQHGIRTVTIGRDSVFKSEEASGLYDLLLAVSQYQNPVSASRSLSSSLLNLDYLQVAAIVDDDLARQSWIDDLEELQQLWTGQGFITMFQSMLDRFDITVRLAQQENSERRITNLLQLAELLQQHSAVTVGMSALLNWFDKQFDEDGNEDAELRLEDDEALVKIVTIHKAKGLQYPIVFVPFLWSCRQVDSNGVVFFHDASLHPCADLGSADIKQNWLTAEKERLAEDVRLLYVALTRARSKVYLAWGKAGSEGRTGYANQTAIAYLLHSTQTPEDLDATAPDGFPVGMDFDADLQTLIKASASTLELQPLPRGDLTAAARVVPVQPANLQLATVSRRGSIPWRINSFTGLTRGIHQPARFSAMDNQADAVLDFPAGSHVGLLVHSLLENIDFQQDVSQQCEGLLPRFLPRAGISSDYAPVLTLWFEQIITTPLDQAAALTLNKIPNGKRLNELAFDFSLDELNIDDLNAFMQSLASLPLQPISSPAFSGLITGVIDLVFEFEGRYFLADYKTNLLGGKLDDYRPENLQQAMLDRRYDLQSLLYALALHRFLGVRIPDYNYEQHFGGSYYLFLRAMRPQHGCRFGVHFHRPEEQTIHQLDRLMQFSERGVANT